MEARSPDFSPRVGFAWDVTGKGTTVVRGGFSVIYSTFTAVHVDEPESVPERLGGQSCRQPDGSRPVCGRSYGVASGICQRRSQVKARHVSTPTPVSIGMACVFPPAVGQLAMW